MKLKFKRVKKKHNKFYPQKRFWILGIIPVPFLWVDMHRLCYGGAHFGLYSEVICWDTYEEALEEIQ